MMHHDLIWLCWVMLTKGSYIWDCICECEIYKLLVSTLAQRDQQTSSKRMDFLRFAYPSKVSITSETTFGKSKDLPRQSTFMLAEMAHREAICHSSAPSESEISIKCQCFINSHHSALILHSSYMTVVSYQKNIRPHHWAVGWQTHHPSRAGYRPPSSHQISKMQKRIRINWKKILSGQNCNLAIF